jgi:hypothetical protein
MLKYFEASEEIWSWRLASDLPSVGSRQSKIVDNILFLNSAEI